MEKNIPEKLEKNSQNEGKILENEKEDTIEPEILLRFIELEATKKLSAP